MESKQKQLIECVPNFSEGRNKEVIHKIAESIESVKGVRLLNIDPGEATNRTVMTFVGDPESVIEAAFQAIKCASFLIDMRQHKGEHPRFGATDVCPLIPIANISMEETVEYARRLAKKVGEELGISVYCYEFAAFEEKRRSLANCRAGEYEGLGDKLKNPEWYPDFGPRDLNSRSGASAIGARNFLIAYNINLNTTSVRIANAIAFDVREAGRIKREGDPITGKIVKDQHGEPVRIPGSLPKVRAIGWYIQEYGIAQISMNLTDITITSVHQAFDEVCARAHDRGVRVTGSELIGLIPLQALLEAGKYFLRKQHRSLGVSDEELIKIAVKSLGLDDLTPFDPRKRVIEYLLEEPSNKLVRMPLDQFVRETASESPAPGGGSVSAYVGAMGVALGGMVANLSAHKRGWDERWEEFSDSAVEAKKLMEQLLKAVDEDTDAFNRIMEAFKMPQGNEEEKMIRKTAIQSATCNAIEVPLRVMHLVFAGMPQIRKMAETGNPNSISDAGVGALCAYTAIHGAYLNVRINAASLADADRKAKYLEEANLLLQQAVETRDLILKLVDGKIE